MISTHSRGFYQCLLSGTRGPPASLSTSVGAKESFSSPVLEAADTARNQGSKYRVCRRLSFPWTEALHLLDQVQTTQPPSSNSRSFQNECWSESSIWSSIISTSVPIISPRPGSLHWSTAYLNPHPERLTARQEQMVCSSRWEPDGSQHRGCAITWDAPVSTQFNGFCLFFFPFPTTSRAPVAASFFFL